MEFIASQSSPVFSDVLRRHLRLTEIFNAGSEDGIFRLVTSIIY